MGSVDLTRLNYSYIALVPKKTDFPLVKDYRPISVKHGILKIISEVLSLRLSKVMNSLVCLIFESFASIAETINYILKSKTLGILLKIDFEKGFDSVS